MARGCRSGAGRDFPTLADELEQRVSRRRHAREQIPAQRPPGELQKVAFPQEPPVGLRQALPALPQVPPDESEQPEALLEQAPQASWLVPPLRAR